MVKRIYPHWNPFPVVLREGDEFDLGVGTKTGAKFIAKHDTKLENTDNGFVGGYMYLPTGALFTMTKKQIMTAWSKSSNREQTTHKTFDEKMVGKTLVNSGCTMIINSTPEYQMGLDDETNEIENKLPSTFDDAEEFVEDEPAKELVDTTTGEVIQVESKEVKDKFDF
jgi:recombinational DNA repair protein RecT